MKGSFWWSLLIILFVLGVITQRGTLIVFALILSLAAGASHLWARYCLTNVTFRRHLASRQLSYGEQGTLSLEFINAKPLPLAWLLVRDKYPTQVALLTDDPEATKWQQRGWLFSMVALRWYERVVLTYRIRGEHRGHFVFGPAEITSGDVFGFQRRERLEEGMDMLVVYPKVVPVGLLGLPADRPIGEWRARRRVVEDPLRFAMVREYVPGDNPRYIHWRASAHMGGLQSKVFDPSDTLTLVLAVDVQTAPYVYEYVPEYLELVISAAASLAMEALDQRYMVGLCANGLPRSGQAWVYVRAGRHPQQSVHLLTELAALDAFRGIPFVQMLRAFVPQLPFGSTVVAITSMPSESVYEALAEMEELGHRVLLLTVGDIKPDVPEQIAHYHLGGRDAWRHLEALELA